MKRIYSYSTICFCRRIRTLFYNRTDGKKKKIPIIKRDNQESKKEITNAMQFCKKSYFRTESKGELSDTTVLKLISASMA